MADPKLTTTQSFGANANFIAGSLSFVTVELKDPDGKYWTTDVTAGANKVLIKGRKYRVKTAATAGDMTDVGAATATGTVGEIFTADDGMNSGTTATPAGTEIAFASQTSAVVTFSNGNAGLAKVIQSVQSRASIVYIGNADGVGKDGLTPITPAADAGAGKGKVRLMIENAGHEDYSRANAGDIPEGEKGWPTGAAFELHRALNEQDGIAPNPDGTNPVGTWDVDQFRF